MTGQISIARTLTTCVGSDELSLVAGAANFVLENFGDPFSLSHRSGRLAGTVVDDIDGGPSA